MAFSLEVCDADAERCPAGPPGGASDGHRRAARPAVASGPDRVFSETAHIPAFWRPSDGAVQYRRILRSEPATTPQEQMDPTSNQPATAAERRD